MKTLYFSLLLLLVVIFYCNAMPQAVQQSKARCCSGFKSELIPTDKIVDITMTHVSCLKRGFLVETKQGNFFCYSRTSKWAQSLYKQLPKTKGSRQKN